MKKVRVILIVVIALAVTVPSALAYSFTHTVGTQPVDIAVEEIGDSIKWTIDFPMEEPYVPAEGNGKLAVGLIIAKNGDGEGPAFQIHNNDGSDANYPWGTWLMSPWGPAIDTPGSWFGWWSGSVNTPVSTLDWVEATGERNHEDNPDGIFTITIDKSELGESFHWALNLAIGTGFWDYSYEQMSVPSGVTPWFDWTNPLVNMEVPNYEYVPPPPAPEKIGKVTGGLTLEGPQQQISFNAFDNGDSSFDKGKVEYQNFEYPGGLHYTADVMCANVDKDNSEGWFMFQIPDGYPGLSGLYVVSHIVDGGTPGKKGDVYGHVASADLATAQSWCEDGTASVTNYSVTGGNAVVHK